MQSSKNRLANNLAVFLDWPVFRRILVKRHVRSADIVVFKDIFMQDSIQMLFTKNDHMVETFPAKCTDDTFGEWILPWTSWGSWCVFQPKPFYGLFELITIAVLSDFIKEI